MRKPFNLEEALAGNPVVTRGGRRLQQLAKFDAATKFPLVGTVEGEVDQCPQTWRLDGGFDNEESDFDLLMEVEEEKPHVSGYVNVWKNEDGYSVPYATFHYTLEAAQAERTVSCSGHKKRLVTTSKVTLSSNK
jgi:hypothetical protein